MVVVALETVVVLPQPAKIGLYNLSDLVLPERLLVEPPLGNFFLKRITILPPEDHIVIFLIRTISLLIDKIMSIQRRNRLTFSPRVFIDYL